MLLLVQRPYGSDDVSNAREGGGWDHPGPFSPIISLAAVGAEKDETGKPLKGGRGKTKNGSRGTSPLHLAHLTTGKKERTLPNFDDGMPRQPTEKKGGEKRAGVRVACPLLKGSPRTRR